MKNRERLSLFRKCRSCYDHMGGILATSLFSSLLQHDCVHFLGKSHFDNIHERLPLFITSKGYSLFHSMGIKIPFNIQAYACLDGTEKIPHLGGECGAFILTFLLESKVITITNERRTLVCNSKGLLFLEGLINYTIAN